MIELRRRSVLVLIIWLVAWVGACSSDDAEPVDVGSMDVDATTDDGDVGDTGRSDADVDTAVSDTAQRDADASQPGDDPEECELRPSCDRMVDDAVTTSSKLRIEPENDPSDRYGCVGEPEDRRFVGIDDRVIEARSCGDDQHEYRIVVASCSAIDFLVHVDVEPVNEHCPVGEMAEARMYLDLLSEFQAGCQDGADTECIESNEMPEHGGFSWTIRMRNIFQGDDHNLIDVDLMPETTHSVPYRLRLRVEQY